MLPGWRGRVAGASGSGCMEAARDVEKSCMAIRYYHGPCSGRGRADEMLLRRHHGTESEIAMVRSEEHTSELQSLMRISYAVFCLKKKNKKKIRKQTTPKVKSTTV